MLKLILILSSVLSTSIYAQTNIYGATSLPQPIYQYDNLQRPISERERINMEFEQYNNNNYIPNEINTTSPESYANTQNKAMGLPVITLTPPQIPSATFLKGPTFPQTNGHSLPTYGNQKVHPVTNFNNPYTIVPW